MKKEYSNIEDLFKNSFNDYKVDPTPGAWKGINGKLNLKQFLSLDFKHFNVYYLSAIVGIMSAIGLLLSDNNQKEISQATQNTFNKTEIIGTDFKSDEKNEGTAAIISDKIDDNNKIRIQKRVEKKKLSTPIETSRVYEVIPLTQNQKIEKVTNGLVDSMSELKKITVLPPKPLFKLSNKEGCAPFKISLNNFTELAQSYEWSFGDGSKSKDKNPSHTYLYPGVYTVRLKATGVGGTAISIIDSVCVHEKVNNKVSTSFNNQLTEGELFAISVNNNQTAEFEWSFGDGNYSFEKNPTHTYQKAGMYSISLITLTDNNCYDSVKVADAIVVKSNKKIVFPNAFYPNPSGSSTGKYSNKSFYNDVFHPKVKGELVEYSLKIFAKTGLLIFESNDLEIGWDGYYQNRMMPAGVYPYVAIIKFEGDDKPIQKRGNITVLHKK